MSGNLSEFLVRIRIFSRVKSDLADLCSGPWPLSVVSYEGELGGWSFCNRRIESVFPGDPRLSCCPGFMIFLCCLVKLTP